MLKVGGWVRATAKNRKIRAGDVGICGAIGGEVMGAAWLGDVGGHNSDWRTSCKKGHGWWVDPSILEPYTPTVHEVVKMRGILDDPSILEGCRVRDDEPDLCPICGMVWGNCPHWIDMPNGICPICGKHYSSCPHSDKEVRAFLRKQKDDRSHADYPGQNGPKATLSWIDEASPFTEEMAGLLGASPPVYPQSDFSTFQELYKTQDLTISILKGDSMNPVIAKLYERTTDAMLVQKWFGRFFAMATDPASEAYVTTMHRNLAIVDDLLKEATRLEAEEKKDK
jgi:hypothetical protein